MAVKWAAGCMWSTSGQICGFGPHWSQLQMTSGCQKEHADWAESRNQFLCSGPSTYQPAGSTQHWEEEKLSLVVAVGVGVAVAVRMVMVVLLQLPPAVLADYMSPIPSSAAHWWIQLSRQRMPA